MNRKSRELLDERLQGIEALFQSGNITEKDMDVLDTAARMEAGILSYEDVHSAVVDGFIPETR